MGQHHRPYDFVFVQDRPQQSMQCRRAGGTEHRQPQQATPPDNAPPDHEARDRSCFFVSAACSMRAMISLSLVCETSSSASLWNSSMIFWMAGTLGAT